MATIDRETKAEMRIEKEFTMQDYYNYKEAKDRKKETLVDVVSDPLAKKPVAFLTMPNNMPNLLLAREWVQKLVDAHDWTYPDALERLMPESAMTKIVNTRCAVTGTSLHILKLV